MEVDCAACVLCRVCTSRYTRVDVRSGEGEAREADGESIRGRAKCRWREPELDRAVGLWGGSVVPLPLPLPSQSWGEGGHLQRDALPQLLGLLAPLQVLKHVVELHHSHRGQTEGPAGTADDVDKVVVVGRGQVDQPVVDILQWGTTGGTEEQIN